MDASPPERPGPGGRAPTRRSRAKEVTRQKIITAARRLFDESGYEDATVRDIAKAAGMSTGAVFANFADKSDLFIQIMAQDGAELALAVQAACDSGSDLEESLVNALMAGYRLYLKRLPLVRGLFAYSWSATGHVALGALRTRVAMRSALTDRLTAAVAQGVLRPDANIALRGQMLDDLYLANYRAAVFDYWDLDRLEAHVRGQVRVVLAGARAQVG